MSLLESNVKSILTRLSKGGWIKVFDQHGLNIQAKDLRKELSKPLENIDRKASGFEDFSQNATRGIEPGCPSESLLFHGLASSNVNSFLDSKGIVQPVSIFPTSGEIEIIENFVYGIEPPTIDEIRVTANNAPLAVVVFAKEYRSAVNTVHRQHADFCYSRTGISRVGTCPAHYLEEARGYLPYNEDAPQSIRVMPCRYGAYIAALVPGDKNTHGPSRYIEPTKAETNTTLAGTKTAGTRSLNNKIIGHDKSDDARRFWVPIHKLFSGDECIFDKEIALKFSAKHINEKLRRIHLMFGRIGHDGGWQEPDISKPPFVFTENIANLSTDTSDGTGLIVPIPQKSLVEVAKYKRKTLVYDVPETSKYEPIFTYQSTLGIRNEKDNNARRAPEYVHARYAVNYKGKKEQDLNDLKNIAQIIEAGRYKAKHVLDFTADGYVDVSCPAINMEIPHRLPAFSIVAPPDFYAGLKQSDLMQWWEQSVPSSLQNSIWPKNPGAPQALSDQRIAANQELPDIKFDENDDTMTALVGPLKHHSALPARILPPKNRRGSMLPDGAAGIFAPGWDVSFDQKFSEPDDDRPDAETSIITFFSGYGLGSPFPEDTKLCAALSSYWPAAAPDTTRTFAPNGKYATATPLLDRALGLADDPPWDGVMGPRIVDHKRKIIEYSDIEYADYVSASLKNEFDLSALTAMTPRDYLARTLAMARAYQALGAETTEQKTEYAVLSFDYADCEKDAELQEALKHTDSNLQNEHLFRFELFKTQPQKKYVKKPFNKIWVTFKEILTIYADTSTVLMRNDDKEWIEKKFRD